MDPFLHLPLRRAMLTVYCIYVESIVTDIETILNDLSEKEIHHCVFELKNIEKVDA